MARNCVLDHNFILLIVVVLRSEEEIDEEIKLHVIRLPNGYYQCLDCSLHSKYKQIVHRHVESKHVIIPQGFSCPICPKILGTRSARAMHLVKHRKLAAAINENK